MLFLDMLVIVKIAQKTGLACPELEVWENLHINWGYVKDQGNIILMVDAGSG